MKTIYKYPIGCMDEPVAWMPIGAEVLTVQVQHGVPCLWAIVDPSRPSERRTFRVAGTGHPLGEVGRYIGTFQLSSGALVFHVFEVGATDER